MIATKTEQLREAKGKALALGLVVMALMAAYLLLTAKPAHADITFTVNSTGDSGDQNPGDGSCFTGILIFNIGAECTLRAALEEANASAGADTINFAISGVGPHTISPGDDLPAITKRVTIDGYTESLDEGANPAKPNTASAGTNAVLKIELSGKVGTAYAYGLGVGAGASNVVIRGLVVNDFDFNGVSSSTPGISLSGTGHRLEGNFIGTNPDGTAAERNGSGVFLSDAANSTIGGTSPAARNLISGNVYAGVEIFDSSGNIIQGNIIGPDKNGNVLANSNAVLGGVMLTFGTGNRILSNSIFSNASQPVSGRGLGIDLGDNGVTANDDKDPDTGENRLQNYPVLDPIQKVFNNPTTFSGNLNSTPSTRKKKRAFIIQFFSSPAADASGYGEGKTFLGQVQKTTNRQGNASFSFTTGAVSEGDYITATATNKATGDTSEFSKAERVQGLVIGP